MSEELFRLVYYSRNKVAGNGDVISQAIHTILEASQRNNAKAGVTGALLFNAGCFGQVLEGSRRALEATFERIQRDARHDDVALLGFEAVQHRAFPNWSMGFVGSRKVDADYYEYVGKQSGFDPSTMTADLLFERLYALAYEEENSMVR